jgi:hypothetical protein
VVPLADRHYNRQKVGAPQFCPPGPSIVFKAYVGREVKAFWASANPDARFVKHAWAGAWVNTAFRNEGPWLSSEMIRAALALTRAHAAGKRTWAFGAVPPLGMVTFIDRGKTRSKRDAGYCYRVAGFAPARCPRHWPDKRDDCMACHHKTEGGLYALQLLPDAMPAPAELPESPTLFGKAVRA